MRIRYLSPYTSIGRLGPPTGAMNIASTRSCRPDTQISPSCREPRDNSEAASVVKRDQRVITPAFPSVLMDLKTSGNALSSSNRAAARETKSKLGGTSSRAQKKLHEIMTISKIPIGEMKLTGTGTGLTGTTTAGVGSQTARTLHQTGGSWRRPVPQATPLIGHGVGASH